MLLTLLSGCSVVSNKFKHLDGTELAKSPLNLVDSIPWPNEQKMLYVLYDGEKKIGDMEIDITTSIDKKSYIVSKIKKSETEEIKSGAAINSDTLMPTKSYYNKRSNAENENYEITTSYLNNWLIQTRAKKSSEQTVELPTYYYDNESLLVILGALSYKDLNTFKLNTAIPLTGRVEPLTFEYEGVEEVNVPFQETKCYKVTSGDMSFWYSVNDRILYQHKENNRVYKLVSLNYNKETK